MSGTDGVLVYHAALVEPKEKSNLKWNANVGISTVQSFQYKTVDSCQVWQSYNIGQGSLVKLDKADLSTVPKLRIIEENDLATFTDIKPRKAPRQMGDPQFKCPKVACTMAFSTYEELNIHLETEEHSLILEKETLFDKAKRCYAEKLLQGPSNVGENQSMFSEVTTEDDNSEGMGFAQFARKDNKPFNEKQTTYLLKEYEKGITGRKSKPDRVSREMREAMAENGLSRLFSPGEYLTTTQIASFFSRETQKRKQVSQEDFNAIQHMKMLKRMEEQTFQEEEEED